MRESNTNISELFCKIMLKREGAIDAAEEGSIETKKIRGSFHCFMLGAETTSVID
jgi:hypothetical protein